jgi:chemotaxis receptor (MCP) glutamine deamidase CheD/FixJ family two-component response regulator
MSKKIKVLIVDDQALVLDILQKGLSRDPMVEIVGTATDGQLALNQLPRLKPDVIVLDMEMPRMNGIQFLNQMMPNYSIPTIVLSALTHKDSKLTQQAFELGAFDFLPKPQGGARELPKLIVQLLTKIRIAAAQDVTQFKRPEKPMDLPKNELDRNAKTNQIILGMGAYEVSNEPGKILKIFALGSCVGVGLFCPSKNVVAMSHVVLPSSTTDPEKSKTMPGYFADTAINAMLDKMISLGCEKNRIFAKMAGGAKTTVDIGDYFGIGQRNAVAVKATLLKQGVRVLAEDVGNTYSRTVHVIVGDNNYYLLHPDKGKWEI